MSAIASSPQHPMQRTNGVQGPVPATAGIGLKSVHYEEILTRHPCVAWFEIHPENYMGDGGPSHNYLTAIRARYPLSMHSVGLSLGSSCGVDAQHLGRIAKLVNQYEPALVSDHLSWSTFDGHFFNDLLPLPYTLEALDIVAQNVGRVQDTLKRQILVENPSSYLAFANSEMSEPAFLGALVRRSGCALLLDVNNVYVSARNHGWDANAYIATIPANAVREIHVAGHLVEHVDGTAIHVDDHGSPVCPAVWDLYRQAIAACGRVPTLVEWDANIPALDLWLAEAATADRIAAGAIARNIHAAAR